MKISLLLIILLVHTNTQEYNEDAIEEIIDQYDELIDFVETGLEENEFDVANSTEEKARKDELKDTYKEAKDELKDTEKELKGDYKTEEKEAKADYKSGDITKDEYKTLKKEIKAKEKGVKKVIGVIQDFLKKTYKYKEDQLKATNDS